MCEIFFSKKTRIGLKKEKATNNYFFISQKFSVENFLDFKMSFIFSKIYTINHKEFIIYK